MIKKIFFCLIFLSHWAVAQSQVIPHHLAPADQKIFLDTIQKCSGGTWSSAFKLGFSAENLSSSVTSSLNLLSYQMFNELNLRVQNRGLSVKVFETRKSEGFWLALTECYGYQYGQLNRGNLIKQLIDLGHLTTESLGLVAGVGVLRVGAAVWSAARTQYPLALSFVSAGMTSLIVSQLVRELYFSHPASMTPQDKQEYQKLEAQIFHDANAAIAETIQRSKHRIQFLESRLQDPQLSEQDRSKLLTQLAAIKNSLAKLYELNPRLKQS